MEKGIGPLVTLGFVVLYITFSLGSNFCFYGIFFELHSIYNVFWFCHMYPFEIVLRIFLSSNSLFIFVYLNLIALSLFLCIFCFVFRFFETEFFCVTVLAVLELAL